MSFGKAGSKKQDELASLGLTPQTQALLQDVMQRRGLSLRATQDVVQSVKEGDATWVHRVNTGLAGFKAPDSKTKPLVKAPKVGKPVCKPVVGPPASFSGKRMATSVPEREMWTGGAPAPNRELLKEHCAQVMELGAEGLKKKAAEQVALLQAQAQAASARPMDVKEALVEQLVQEVQERREFLEAMRAAGKGDAYDAQIRAEIGERMVALRKYGVDTTAGAGARSNGAKPIVLPPWQRNEPTCRG